MLTRPDTVILPSGCWLCFFGRGEGTVPRLNTYKVTSDFAVDCFRSITTSPIENLLFTSYVMIVH